MPPKLRRDLADGDRIGPYVVDARLGEGGMAEVFAGHHPQTGARVALKRSLLDPETLHIRLPMFQREARIACKLLHPNIVTTYELQVDADGNPVLVMELLDGVPVKEAGALLRKTSGGLRLIVELVHASARALDYLHEQQDPDSQNAQKDGGALGLIHRDVAPDNLFITFAGTVKLLDFGLAKEADDARLTRTGMLKGKAAYMSPEQATGAPLDQRTDQYALGITTYWLLTGVLPFERDNVPKTLNAVMADPLTPPSSVNRQLNKKVDAVLQKAVARDRTRRFPSCSAFATALDEALAKAEAPVANVTLGAIAREAAEGQKPTIVIAPARGAVVGRQQHDTGFDMTDPSGRVQMRSDDERTVVEPAPVRFSTSPEGKIPARSSDEHTRREEVNPRGASPRTRTPIVRRPSGTELGSDGDTGPVPQDDGLDPLFTMPHSLPSGLHPAPPPSSLGAVLAGVSLAVVIAGAGVLWLLLPEVLGGVTGDALADASIVLADGGESASGARSSTSSGDMDEAIAPLGARTDAGPRAIADAGSALAPPAMRTLKLKGPAAIEWRGEDGVIARGTASAAIAETQTMLTAYDPEYDVTTLVPVPPGGDVLDYAQLPRTEVQILVRPWADVSVGKKQLGLTPLKPLKLVAGRYRVTLKHDAAEQVHEIDVGGSDRMDLRYRF